MSLLQRNTAPDPFDILPVKPVPSAGQPGIFEGAGKTCNSTPPTSESGAIPGQAVGTHNLTISSNVVYHWGEGLGIGLVGVVEASYGPTADVADGPDDLHAGLAFGLRSSLGRLGLRLAFRRSRGQAARLGGLDFGAHLADAPGSACHEGLASGGRLRVDRPRAG